MTNPVQRPPSNHPFVDTLGRVDRIWIRWIDEISKAWSDAQNGQVHNDLSGRSEPNCHTIEAITNLSTTLASLDKSSEISDLQSSVSSINSALDVVNGQIVVINNTTANLQGQINSINQEISTLDNAYVAKSGDAMTGALYLPLLGFDTGYVVTGTEPTGSSYWDESEQTFSDVLGDGVIGQRYQEQFYPVINQTGSDIPDGAVCAYDGTDGNSGKLKVKLGIASASEPAFMQMGLATHEILNGEYGKVTFFGKVRGIQTDGADVGETWADDDILYVSSTTAGKLTNVMPSAPIPAIPFAVVVNAHATNGTLFVRPSYPQRMTDLSDVNGTPLTENGQFPVWDVTNQYFDFTANINQFVPKVNLTLSGRGFEEPSSTTITYDSGTRKITFGGNLYWDYDPVQLSTWVSDARPNTNGAWFLYYNDSGFQWSNMMWEFYDAPIAFGFVGASAELWIREAHGMRRNCEQHRWSHQSTGTYRTSGGGFTAGTYTLSSTTATDRRPQIPQTIIWDEDVPSILSALTTNAYSHLYLSSTNTVNITVDNAEITVINGSVPRYNAFSAGSWSLADVPASHYAKYFVVAVPVTDDATNQKKRYLFQMAQTTSLNLSTIQAIAPSDMNWGELAGVLPEFDYIGEIIVRVVGTNWSLISVATVQGSRVTQSGGGSGFLSTVTTDGTTILGSGVPSAPIYVAPDLSLTSLATTGKATSKTAFSGVSSGGTVVDFATVSSSTGTVNITANDITANGALSVKGNTTLGDTSSDITIINGVLKNSTMQFLDIDADFGGLWGYSLTPSGSNYSLLMKKDGAVTVINGGSSVGIRNNNVERIVVNSTGIGFFGTTPVAKPSTTNDITSVRNALISLGLIS